MRESAQRHSIAVTMYSTILHRSLARTPYQPCYYRRWYLPSRQLCEKQHNVRVAVTIYVTILHRSLAPTVPPALFGPPAKWRAVTLSNRRNRPISCFTSVYAEPYAVTTERVSLSTKRESCAIWMYWMTTTAAKVSPRCGFSVEKDEHTVPSS